MSSIREQAVEIVKEWTEAYQVDCAGPGTKARLATSIEQALRDERDQWLTDERIQEVIMSPENAALLGHLLAEYATAKGKFETLITQAVADERERCAKAICLFCAEPEHYGPAKEIEGSKRLWHADLRNDCNGVVQCQAAAIRKED